MPVEQLIQGFDPEGDSWDRRILYEVTGIKLDENDYTDDEENDTPCAGVLRTSSKISKDLDDNENGLLNKDKKQGD